MTEKAQLHEFLRLMLSIRLFEEKATERYLASWKSGQFMGALHTYHGEEAIAVGVCQALRPDDYVVSTHRGHGHCLAKGADPGRMLAELSGRVDGYSRGHGGSMHIFAPDLGLLGGNGIVGGGLPLALGAAFSAQYRQSGQLAVCFFGDGASKQGTFHESLNLAALWDLPVLYLCENNCYAATTPTGDSCPVHDIAELAHGYGCPGVVCDGNDVLAVHEAAQEAVAHVRAGKGPYLLEAKTYRMKPHCMVIRETRGQGRTAGLGRQGPDRALRALPGVRGPGHGRGGGGDPRRRRADAGARRRLRRGQPLARPGHRRRRPLGLMAGRSPSHTSEPGDPIKVKPMIATLTLLAAALLLLSELPAGAADPVKLAGAGWSRLAEHAAFSLRDTAEGVVFQGKLWLSNGYITGGGVVRDLWNSSDGVNWTKVLDDTPYDAYAEMAVYDGKLWAVKQSVWNSADGLTWNKVLAATPFGVRGLRRAGCLRRQALATGQRRRRLVHHRRGRVDLRGQGGALRQALRLRGTRLR